MKKEIKKISESELLMAKAVCEFYPIDRNGVLIEKGDMKAPNWDAMLDWDNFLDWEEDEAIPMKDMTRQKRRKYRFSKDMARRTMAYNMGYDMDAEINPSKVKDLLSANHSDRMYFRGNKVQKKLGKPITTIEGLNMMAQIEREAEEDREIERKEAERQFMLDELASTTDDLQRLEFVEMEAKKAVAELIRTICEANGKLVDYQAKINGLKAAEEVLRKKISKLEEAVNS